MFSKIFPKIHSEGYKFIVISTILTIVFYTFSNFLGLVGLVLTIWVYYFFRDPERVIIDNNNYLVSPADGEVIKVEETDGPKELALENKKFNKIFTIKKFPIYMGTVPKNFKTISRDMNFFINKITGSVQIFPRVNLNSLYFKSHGSGKIGKTWETHHDKFFNFINLRAKREILEIGGGHNSISVRSKKILSKVTSFDINGKGLNKGHILYNEFFSNQTIKKYKLHNKTHKKPNSLYFNILNKLKYNTTFGTPEAKNNGYPDKIQTVSDAFKGLSDLILQSEFFEYFKLNIRKKCT